MTYDASAQADQRWKLIWHHYLQIAGERYFQHGWLSNKDALYLSVGCFQINPRENRIALLACAHPCTVTDAAAWRYVSTLLLNADAQTLGFARFSAADLFTANGKIYLWVTPVSDSPFPDSYNGCRAYRFNNLAAGELHTDAESQPITALTLQGLPDSFNGACVLLAAAGEQAFYSQFMVSEPDRFQIFRASSETCFSSLSP